MKRKFFVGGLAVLFFLAVLFLLSAFFVKKNNRLEVDISDIVSLQNNPFLSESVNDILVWQEKIDLNPENIEYYLGLGLAWKSLADRVTSTAQTDYYNKAISVYRIGAEKTNYQNTSFLINIGHVAMENKQFELSEEYFLKALAVTPGDQEIYIRLAELYEYHLKKNPNEILLLIDTGIKTAVVSNRLQTYKKNLLERHPDLQTVSE